MAGAMALLYSIPQKGEGSLRMPPPRLMDAKLQAYEMAKNGPPKLQLGLLFKMLRYYNGDMKWQMAAFLFFFVFQTASFQAMQYSIKYLIDTLIPSGVAFHMVVFALLWIAAFGVHALFTLLAARYRILIVRNFVARMRGEIIKKLQVLSMKFFDKEGTGSISARILMDMDKLQGFFDWTMQMLLEAIISIVLVLPLLYSIDPMLTLITVIYVPCVPLVQKLFMKRMVESMYLLRNRSARLSSKLVDFISGIKHIRIFASEDEHGREMIEEVEKVRDLDIKFSMYMRSLRMAIQFLSDFTPILIWVAGGIIIAQRHQLQIGALVAYVALVRMFYGRIEMLFSSFEQIVTASPSVVAINEVLGSKDVEPSAGRKRDFEIDGSISFKSVDFNYETRPGSLQLDGISVEIKPGERVALAGESGSGKSTFVNALLGLYPIKSGKILFGGLDISTLHLPSLRAQVALMTQETFLFNTSLYENLRFANPKASFEDVREACRKAQILDFIESLPESFDTVAGERGVQLSGGQRQRIGMARIFLRKPKIIVLDEPSSALDVVTEDRLFETLYGNVQGITLIVIAHRLSTIKNVDRVLVFKDAKIVEQGTFDELKNRDGGAFAAMVKANDFRAARAQEEEFD